MIIRNKKNGEIREISENELDLYGLGGQLNKLGVVNSLWNNIRANAGSGKKPTAEMLKQERKIRSEEKEYGGSLPTSTLGVPYQDKEYMYKNGGEKEDWLTKLLNGTTGNIVQQTIRDQVPVVGPAYNATTQILENNPSDYARTVNIALEGLKLPAPFWGDLAINALQEGVSYMGNKNPVGIDRSYKSHFKNEKGPKYQEGGENPKDWDKFTAFNKTLPSNLRDDNFKYGDYSNYDLYGMWEAAGKPNSFEEVKDKEFFPLQDDGLYHGFSVGKDGIVLKSKNHPSIVFEALASQLSPDIQNQLLIQREDGRLQYVPKKQTGGNIYDKETDNLLAQIASMIADGEDPDMVAGSLVDNGYSEEVVDSLVEEAIDRLTELGDYEEEDINQLEDIKVLREGGIPDRYKNQGFTKVGAKRKSNRPGKKWMVLAKKGDKYKVVHGGYKGMKDYTQHGSEKRRERFWSRMGGKDSSKVKDPFSPLYWHKRFGTWANGGETPGNPPIIVRDPNHPRLIAYQDSLNMYNFGKDGENSTIRYWETDQYEDVLRSKTVEELNLDEMENRIKSEQNLKTLSIDLPLTKNTISPVKGKIITYTTNEDTWVNPAKRNLGKKTIYTQHRNYLPVYKKPEEEVIYQPVPTRSTDIIQVPISEREFVPLDIPVSKPILNPPRKYYEGMNSKQEKRRLAGKPYYMVNSSGIKLLVPSGDTRLGSDPENTIGYNRGEAYVEGKRVPELDSKFVKKQIGGNTPIVDPEGQRKHPGKTTRIPSNRITMEGINYPVLAIGDNGKANLMLPGQEYLYLGVNFIDEVPFSR